MPESAGKVRGSRQERDGCTGLQAAIGAGGKKTRPSHPGSAAEFWMKPVPKDPPTSDMASGRRPSRTILMTAGTKPEVRSELARCRRSGSMRCRQARVRRGETLHAKLQPSG